MSEHVEVVKNIGDAGAAIGAIGAFFHWMPEVAAFLSVIWYGIRLYEYVKNKSTKL